jgi:hypothetical protein
MSEVDDGFCVPKKRASLRMMSTRKTQNKNNSAKKDKGGRKRETERETYGIVKFLDPA